MQTRTTLRLEPLRVVWPQSPRGVATLENDDGEALRFVNPTSERGCAELAVTRLDTGSVAVHRRLARPGVDDDAVVLAPGEALRDVVDLGARAPLPGPGMYDVAARFQWEDGAAESVPARIEVLPGPVAAMAAGVVNGGATGLVECAWVLDGPDGRAVFRTLLHGGDGRFLETTRLADLAGAAPTEVALSTPPGRPPTATRVAWIADDEFVSVRHRRGATEPLVRPTVPGARLVGPLADHAAGADALLLGDSPGGWWVRNVRVADDVTPGAAAAAPGPRPSLARTALWDESRRHTVLLAARAPGTRDAVTTLYTLEWSELDLAAPVPVVEWLGSPLAMDHRALPDGSLAGAAVLDLGADPRSGSWRHAIQRWRVTPAGAFTQGALRWIDWPSPAPLRAAAVRVDAEGNPFAVVQGRDGGRLGTVDAEGRLTAIPEASAWPAEVLFLGGSEPAVLYHEPGVGLRLHGTVPIKPTISPAGAR